MCHNAWLVFKFFVDTGFCHVAQAGSLQETGLKQSSRLDLPKCWAQWCFKWQIFRKEKVGDVYLTQSQATVGAVPPHSGASGMGGAGLSRHLGCSPALALSLNVAAGPGCSPSH